MRACIAGFLLAAAVPAAAGVAVDRRLIVVAFNVAGHVQDGPQAGYYYVAFGGGAGTLRGPEPQGEGWVAYVLFHRGRFYLGRGPAAIPPSVFRFTRPPEPYSRGLVTQDRRGVVVELPILELAAGGVPVRTVKVNVVTLDGDRRLLDALGKGSDDRLGFVTLDLARELYQPFTDPQGDAPEDYDIFSGSVSVKVP